MIAQPLALPENGLDRRDNDHFVAARLSSGVTLSQAQQELARISVTIKEQYPDTNRNVTALVELLLACYLPARRATKVDPMAALRCE